MVIDHLTIRTAQRHVENFATEVDVMQQHHEAMQRWDCDAFLQLGIDAFEWLLRSDLAIRSLEREAKITEAEAIELDNGLRLLCKGWMKTCEIALKWPATQEARGFELENLHGLLKCREELAAILEFDDQSTSDQTLASGLTTLRDLALEEHRDGQTAEFLS
jgi:hypothetical protein